MPVERAETEPNAFHTSAYARGVAIRVMDELGEIWDADSRVDAEIRDAEYEYSRRLWYFRALEREPDRR